MSFNHALAFSNAWDVALVGLHAITITLQSIWFLPHNIYWCLKTTLTHIRIPALCRQSLIYCQITHILNSQRWIELRWWLECGINSTLEEVHLILVRALWVLVVKLLVFFKTLSLIAIRNKVNKNENIFMVILYKWKNMFFLN